MGVRMTWVKGSPEALIRIPERVTEQLASELAEALEAIVRNAALNAREFTAERGRPTSRYGGRVDTAAMLEAIKSDVEVNARKIIGKFGFIDKQEDYFLFQTVTGFTHWASSAFIEPTFALRDAELIAIQDLGAAIRAAIRSVRI